MSTRAAGVLWGGSLLLGLALTIGAQPAGLVILAVAGCVPPPVADGDRRLWWALAAVVWATTIALPPLLSDDIYRYVLDGAMSRAGYHPFAWAPSAPIVQDIAPHWRALTNHPELRTIYPATAQALFALLAWSPLAWKTATAGAWLAFCRWLDTSPEPGERSSGRSARRCHAPGLTLALHPLSLLAVGIDGHVDAWGAGLLGIGLALHARRATRAGLLWGGLIGTAAAIKYFPFIALGAPGHRTRATVAAALVFGVMSAPLVAGAGAKAAGSLHEYQQHWSYNGAIFETSAALLQPGQTQHGQPCRDGVRPAVWQGQTLQTCPAAPASSARTRARLLWATIVICATLGSALLWSTTPQVAARTVFVGFSIFLLSSPTAHGWYFLWLLVPAAMLADRGALILASSGVLAFWTPVSALAGQAWEDIWWPTPVGLTAALGFWGLRALSAPRRTRVPEALTGAPD